MSENQKCVTVRYLLGDGWEFQNNEKCLCNVRHLMAT